MMTTDKIWKSRLTAKLNERFICIVPQSGYRLAFADPMATERLLVPDAPNDVLGEAVSSGLAESRFLSLEEANAVRATADSRYQEWVTSLMGRYGFKTKNALFKNMKSCSVMRFDGNLVVVPSHHDRADSWSRSKDDGIEDVVIAADSSVADIGAALRLGFDRCT